MSVEIMQEMVCLLRILLYMPRFHDSLQFFGTSIASFDPETVQQPAFSTLSAMFTGVCGPPEKQSLTFLPHSTVLRVTVKLAYIPYMHLTHGCNKLCYLESASCHCNELLIIL